MVAQDANFCMLLRAMKMKSGLDNQLILVSGDSGATLSCNHLVTKTCKEEEEEQDADVDGLVRWHCDWVQKNLSG